MSVQYSSVMPFGVDDMNCGAWQRAVSEHGEYSFLATRKMFSHRLEMKIKLKDHRLDTLEEIEL